MVNKELFQWPQQNVWYGKPRTDQSDYSIEYWYFPIRISNFFALSVTYLIWSIGSFLIHTVTNEYIQFDADYTQSFHNATCVGQFILIGN